MQIPPKCFLLAALAIPAFADVIGFYGGDFDPSGNNLTNATTALINGSPTGISLYQAFVVPTGGWTVTELFSNNVMGFTPVSAYWEIRSGVSSGNGGTLLYSGTDTTPGLAATGRSLFQFPEWTVSVTGLSLALAPGTYWVTVTPQDPTTRERSFMTATYGANAIGPVPQDVVYINSATLSLNFENANDVLPMPALSYGVYISAPGSVPEPVGVSFLLLGATGLAASVRRRFRRPFVE